MIEWLQLHGETISIAAAVATLVSGLVGFAIRQLITHRYEKAMHAFSVQFSEKHKVVTYTIRTVQGQLVKFKEEFESGFGRLRELDNHPYWGSSYVYTIKTEWDHNRLSFDEDVTPLVVRLIRTLDSLGKSMEELGRQPKAIKEGPDWLNQLANLENRYRQELPAVLDPLEKQFRKLLNQNT